MNASGESHRTLSHEFGHCFGLRHIFQGGCGDGDLVADTPPMLEPLQTCPADSGDDGYNSCTAGSQLVNGFDQIDQIENYMSYNSCQNMFSEGQKTAMDFYLTSSDTITGLKHLSDTANLMFTGTLNPSPCAPLADFTHDLTFICEGQEVTYTDFSFEGTPETYSWTFEGGTPSISADTTPVVTYNTAGRYEVTYMPSNAGGSGSISDSDVVIVSSLTAQFSGIITDGFEDTDNFNNNWVILDPLGGERFALTTDAAATGTSSVSISNFLTEDNGLVDELVTPSYDLSVIEGPELRFNYAFAKRQASNSDELSISYSTDCGNTWQLLTQPISANALETAAPVDTFWIPTSSNWFSRSFSAGLITDETNVRFKFSFQIWWRE